VSVCACVRACVLACMRVCGSPSLVFLDGADYWSLFIYLEGADRRFFFAHIHAWSVKRGQIWENLKIVIIYDDCKDPEYFWISGSKGSAAVFRS